MSHLVLFLGPAALVDVLLDSRTSGGGREVAVQGATLVNFKVLFAQLIVGAPLIFVDTAGRMRIGSEWLSDRQKLQVWSHPNVLNSPCYLLQQYPGAKEWLHAPFLSCVKPIPLNYQETENETYLRLFCTTHRCSRCLGEPTNFWASLYLILNGQVSVYLHR